RRAEDQRLEEDPWPATPRTMSASAATRTASVCAKTADRTLRQYRTIGAPPARGLRYGLFRLRRRGCPFVVSWSALGDLRNGTAPPGHVSHEHLRRAAEVLSGGAVGRAKIGRAHV